MRALLQRVKSASVVVDGTVRGEIGKGLLIFLGVGRHDSGEAARALASRCAAMRIIGDDEGRMNRSVKETAGSALVISQFTLYADTRKGHRPSFTGAAPPARAEELYEEFVEALRADLGRERVATGVFGAMMDVHLINDGPVTVMVEGKGEES